ncbi:MAG: SRPBCC family protein [Saprospiraceae bacterium]|nr:SRPBCC family protein [Saprospiraceae bacterium]
MSTSPVSITVKATIHAPIEKVWKSWTTPEHIMQWNTASDEWHTPHAENDLRVGGKFLSRMAAKDGSFSFDFEGVYTKVNDHEAIAYQLGDDRKVEIHFAAAGDDTLVTEIFEAESTNPIELQQTGWQAILDNFKKYTEAL